MFHVKLIIRKGNIKSLTKEVVVNCWVIVLIEYGVRWVNMELENTWRHRWVNHGSGTGRTETRQKWIITCCG